MSCSCHCTPCYCKGNQYGCFSLLLDGFMICATGGLWIVWIFVREMRKR